MVATLAPHPIYEPRTLHGDFRRRELTRINAENTKLVKALNDIKPTLARGEWQKHQKKHIELKKLRQSSNRRQVPSQPGLDSWELESQQSRRKFNTDQDPDAENCPKFSKLYPSLSKT